MSKETEDGKQNNAPLVGSSTLLDAAIELACALDFYDRVQASSEDERIAVGRDHFDLVFRAARKVASASNARVSGAKRTEHGIVGKEIHETA